jgi:spore germination protein KB
MLEKGRITYKQLILLIALSRIILTITFLPALKEPPGNQDIWLSELLYLPLQLLFALPIYFLWKKFPNQTIIQYSQTIAGKLGKLAGVLILWYFIQQAAIATAQFSLFFVSAVMPETPVLFFTSSFILVCAYATHKGLEVIGRLSELFAPLVMIAIITAFLLLGKDMDLNMLRPVLENGIIPVTQGSFIYAARSLEILGLAMLLPYLNNPQKIKSVIIVSFALVSLFFILITIPVLTILEFDEAKSLTFPYYSIIRLINVGDFLERIQSMHMAIWILGTFIKVTFKFYLAVLGLSQLLNLEDYRPLILPTGAILIPLSLLLGPSLTTLAAFTSYKIFTWYSLFFILLIPSLLLLIAIIQKKGVRSP